MTDDSGRWGSRDRIIDVGNIAVAALAALAFAAEGYQSGRLTGTALVLGVVLAGAGCAALWWRRPHPVGVALLLVPLAAVTELVSVAVLIAVFTVAVHRRWPVATAVTGLHLLANLPYAVVRPDPDLTPAAGLAIDFVLLAVAVAIGMAVRTRRETVATLRERAARAEREAGLSAQRLRVLERERIAREMHDVLAHRISLVSLHAGALEIRPDLSIEEVARAAGTIRANAHQALDDLREILGVLRGGEVGELRPQPGLADLADLLTECRSTGMTVAVDSDLPEPEVPLSVSRTAYRIVQEGLTNARKHAPGAPVLVSLDRTAAGELHVWVRNPLVRSGSTIPGTRSGLVGLAERVGLAGGRLDHGIRRGAEGDLAFHLEAWLPCPA